MSVGGGFYGCGEILYYLMNIYFIVQPREERKDHRVCMEDNT